MLDTVTVAATSLVLKIRSCSMSGAQRHLADLIGHHSRSHRLQLWRGPACL